MKKKEGNTVWYVKVTELKTWNIVKNAGCVSKVWIITVAFSTNVLQALKSLLSTGF